MNVSLVAHTPDPDRLCAQAALVSKWSKGWSIFNTAWNDKTDLQHLTDALEKGHVSVIEHACFTFSLEGISRACSHQLVRHRLASYTQQSQRYVTLEDPDTFVIPDSIKSNKKAQSVLLTQPQVKVGQKLPVGKPTTVSGTQSIEQIYNIQEGTSLGKITTSISGVRFLNEKQPQIQIPSSRFDQIQESRPVTEIERRVQPITFRDTFKTETIQREKVKPIIKVKQRFEPRSRVSQRIDNVVDQRFEPITTPIITTTQVGVTPIISTGEFIPPPPPPPTIITPPPTIELPEFGFSERPTKRKPIKVSRRAFKYSPSFTAIALDIKGKGKVPKSSKVFTGLELRPIIETNGKKKKKKRRKNSLDLF